MNVTVATELIRNYVGWTHEKFDATLARLPAGSRGLLLLPYFEGERTPNVPAGTGVLFGVNHRTWCAEASPAPPKASLGMNYGLRRLADLGVEPTQIRATGGAQNPRRGARLWPTFLTLRL